MSASQISFVEFALTAQALCTPSVTPSVAAVAAPCVAADGGECINVEAFMRRVQRARLVRNWRALPPSYGVEIGGCVVLYHSRARAFNQAVRYSYARFVEVCQ